MRRKDILTPKEKYALYYIMKYPTSTDKELAKMTRLKLSTVTAIRRRLRNMGIYRGVNIALMPNMGAELLTVSYGSLNRLVKGVGENFYKEIGKNTFYMLTDGMADIAIGYEKNYTGALKTSESFKAAMQAKGLPLENWNTVFFPAEGTYVFNFFEYAPVVRTMFNLEVSASERKVEPHPLFGVKEVISLTKKERLGVAGFLAAPEGTDVVVSDKTKLSRQAVASMRRRFAGKVIQPARDLSIEKLGLELIAFTHDRFNIGIEIEKKVDVLADALSEVPAFFAVASNTDGVYLSAHRSYAEYVESHRKRLGVIAKANPKMVDTTTSVLYSVKHLARVRDYTFLEMATEFLGLPEL
ncbi:MAG: winged helix-turn-helix domain-containing protein [Thermoplasmata archaeon]|nr:winged helix-turn-helix domain-containing protein [Thermoplasmata archaeon]